MAAFRFRLEKVLEFQQARSDMEEAKLKQLNAALENLGQSLEWLRATRTAAELEVRSFEILHGSDLMALGAYRSHMDRQEGQLIRECELCRERCEQQRERWAESHRRLRLLQKLKQRRLAAFEFEANRQLEKLAAELFVIQNPPA